jgi:hypothetical protein
MPKSARCALLGLAALALLSPAPASTQPSTPPDTLLDRLVGSWVLEGTIAGAPTTHDVVAGWVLEHNYVELHEVSREKDARGRPAYEATVFLTWEPAARRYSCLWLDSTGNGGLSARAIGHAPPGADDIRLLFPAPDGSTFHTTFAYSRAADTWQWLMDGEGKDGRVPFARVTLRRKPAS